MYDPIRANQTRAIMHTRTITVSLILASTKSV
jgi:hypothetical protein